MRVFMLRSYEFASVLRGFVFSGELTQASAASAFAHLGALAVTLHPFPDAARVLEMARRQNRRAAYDTAYLVLAEDLDAELWTADRRLANNAVPLGVPVRFIGH